MKGMLLKDLLVLRKVARFYILFLCFYGVLCLIGAFDISFIITFSQLMLMMLPLSACALDEQSKWDRYAISLPLGRRGIVGGRYLFVLVLALFALVFSLAASALMVALGKADLTTCLLTTLVSTAVGLLIISILLPLCYKLGSERARPYLFAIVGVPFVAFFLLAKAGLLDGLDLSFLDRLQPPALVGAFSLLPLAALAALGVSYAVSCRIMEHKEF